ncbi:hypothetical protein [Herbaspirillum rubrisubalbicans]|uniref:hypothetical protein n=1 Tax=Herbaspirillum rubrisubalbicans TaxID=80842 RepID=UPI001C13056D|nr:hypothetical protein [Herbaspirillum rubrisubalbicans]
MDSLTFNFRHLGFNVTIIGYEIDGGWRMAYELENHGEVVLVRDTANVYPDFASLCSAAIWSAHLKITALETETAF